MRTLSCATFSQKGYPLLLLVSNNGSMDQYQPMLQSHLTKNHHQQPTDELAHTRIVRFTIYAGFPEVLRAIHHPLLVLYFMFDQCDKCIFLLIETKIVSPHQRDIASKRTPFIFRGHLLFPKGYDRSRCFVTMFHTKTDKRR